MKKRIIQLLFVLVVGFGKLHAEPQVLSEKKPYSTFWTNVGKTWILATLFKDSEVRTYFDAPPPETGVGIAPDRLPLMQEFTYRPTGTTLVLKECRFIQHLDGTKSWGFSYPDSFEYKGCQFGNLCVIMSEKPDFEMFYVISQLDK